jgi:prepilin-type N-terminal cleavage/methylation domain-containing protein
MIPKGEKIKIGGVAGNFKSFTLIELVIVIVIIGILVGISVPSYHRIVERARISEALTVLKTIYDAQMRYAIASDNDAYAPDINTLGIGPLITGKYFNFTVLTDSPTPNPVKNDNETVSYATRNDVAEGIFPANYVIFITETGEVYSTTPGIL